MAVEEAQEVAPLLGRHLRIDRVAGSEPDPTRNQQSAVFIYFIGLPSEEGRREARSAKRALEALAEATGGEAFFTRTVAEAERIAHQVARDVREQYTIEYSPSNKAMNGTFRRINVLVKAPGGPVARTRQGYYATGNRQ